MAERVRGYAPTLIVGLAGAGTIAVAVARPWVTATAQQAGLPPVSVSLDGADIVPLAGALGVLLLASFGAVIATRGWVRRAVGLLIVVSSVVVLVVTVRPGATADALRSELSDHGWTGGVYEQSVQAWRWLAGAGAVCCLFAGLAVVRYATRWPTMGSRYDAPVPGGQDAGRTVSTPGEDSWSDQDVWKAIDQGMDPTRGRGRDGPASE